MTRRQYKNPSGKYMTMTDEQLAADNEAFQRAVERERANEAARASLKELAKTDPRTAILKAMAPRSGGGYGARSAIEAKVILRL